MGCPRYRVAVVGAGWRGKGHIEAFLANRDRFDLTAVCELDTARATRTLAEVGVKLPIYGSAEEMLALEKPDVFCFATHPPTRWSLIELALGHGVRAIAYEKPMALSLAEAKKICEACDRAGVKQIVCHQHKYGKHWQQVREIIRSGRIGQVRQLHATSKGWYYYYITHLVDYAMWLVDYPAASWIAGHIHGRRKLCDTHPSPEYVWGQVGFETGVRAMFECGPLAPSRGVSNFWYDAGITVLGTEGVAEVIVGKGWRAQTKDCAGTISDWSVSLRETEDTIPYIAELARWLDDDSQVHSCNGQLAYRGLEIAEGILLSGLDRVTIVPPVVVSDTVARRLVSELPESPALPEESA